VSLILLPSKVFVPLHSFGETLAATARVSDWHPPGTGGTTPSPASFFPGADSAGFCYNRISESRSERW
jgi:hypothetical protein